MKRVINYFLEPFKEPKYGKGLMYYWKMEDRRDTIVIMLSFIFAMPVLMGVIAFWFWCFKFFAAFFNSRNENQKTSKLVFGAL